MEATIASALDINPVSSVLRSDFEQRYGIRALAYPSSYTAQLEALEGVTRIDPDTINAVETAKDLGTLLGVQHTKFALGKDRGTSTRGC